MDEQQKIISSNLPVICRSCSTCEHRFAGNGEYAKCRLSGYYCMTERAYPTRCGLNYEGWTQRRGFKQRLKDWWNGR